MSSMMCRGVRNCPLVPDCESLLSKYSCTRRLGRDPRQAIERIIPDQLDNPAKWVGRKS